MFRDADEEERITFCWHCYWLLQVYFFILYYRSRRLSSVNA